MKTSDNSIDFAVELSGLLVTEIEDTDLNYHKITLPEYGYPDETGQPLLPVITKLIAIPSASIPDKISLRILAHKSSIYKGYHICPVPTQIKKKSSDDYVYFSEKYIKNEKTYSTNRFYPHEIIKIDRTGFIRDQKVLWLEIHPVQYNPVTGELKACRRIEARLTYDGGSIFTAKGLGPWDELKDELFLNSELSSGYVNIPAQTVGKVTYPTNLTDPNNSADYLAITTDELISNPALDSLACHRAEFNGFDVALVKTSDIYQQFPDSTNDASIKNFLIYAYNHWQAPHFGDDHLGYVLLVGEGARGNVNELPTHFYPSGLFLGETASDYWYSGVNDDDGDGEINDNDRIQDIIIGRFSVENHQELNVIARKTIRYENNLYNNESWRKKISLVSGFDYDFTKFDDLKKLVLNQNFYESIEIIKQPDMNAELVRTAFLNAVNDGRAIVNLQAHGGIDHWSDGYEWILFRSSDIAAFSNQNKLPVILSFACLTASFSYAEKDCLGEIFLNEPNKGAIAFLGASEGVSINTNELLNYKLFKNIMEYPDLGLGIYLQLVNLSTITSSYNLLGDPALSLKKKAQHGLSDLSICPEDIEVTWSPLVGNQEIITAKVYNNGFKEERNVIVLFFDGDPQNGGKQIGDAQVIDSVTRLGDSKIVEVPIDDVMEGELLVYVMVDPHDSIPELEEKNNMACSLARQPICGNVASFVGVDDSLKATAASYGDFNNDGQLDIFVTNRLGPNILYINNGNGSFSDIAAQAGVADSAESYVATFVDYNNDGHLDIFLSTKEKGWVFYRNNGNDTFTHIIPLTDKGEPLSDNAISFIDYNNDGLLDIYCTRNRDQPNVIFRHNRDGTFSDVTKVAGLDSTIGGENAAFGDYDNDGDLDIYVIIPFLHSNILYQNNGDGTFSDVTKIAGLKLQFPKKAKWAIFGDYDNDCDMDIFVCSSNSPNALYQNNGDGSFNDVALAANVDKIHGSSTGTLLDYDNDGYVDLYPRVGLFTDMNIFFKNRGDGSFFEDSTSHFEKTLINAYVALGDYDNDGDLDIYGAVLYDIRMRGRDSLLPPANILYRNKGNDNNWLIVNLRGVKSNSFGIGGRVRLVSGNLAQIRDVTCEFGNRLQTSLPVEFGLGKHEHIDTLEVRWPSGMLDVLTSVKINSILTVKEGYGDINIPGAYQLSQNYPNPFNSMTAIGYAIRGNAHSSKTAIAVSLKIYNILGREIRTLVKESKAAGNYSVSWDGKDMNRRYASSGVYFYRIKAGTFVKTKKLLLLR